MNQEPTTSSRLLEAVAFFKNPIWTRLMSALYTKYIEHGRVRGQVILTQCTSDEQREIARFLGKSLSPSANLSIRLADFQQALAKSFACELPSLLLALFPEYSHTTRPQQKEQQALSQQAFDEKLSAFIESLPLDSLGRSWLQQGKHGRDASFVSRKTRRSPHRKTPCKCC